MNDFIRGYVNLEGKRIGNFEVYGLSSFGASRSGAPNWECVCRLPNCRMYQVFSHAELTTALESGRPGETLFCKNTSCSGHRTAHSGNESLADLRRQEREAVRRSEAEEAERKRNVANKAAQAKAEEARLAPLRADWHRYSLHLIKQPGVSETEILNFSRWMEIGDAARQRLMQLVEENGG